jgi:alkylation response protein AidB-like acyl-CoA dehydrogenase
VLARLAGPAGALELERAGGAYDHALHDVLDTTGYLGLASEPGLGPLEAALVVDEIARAGGVVTAAASALVAPAVSADLPAGPLALAELGQSAPVRHAPAASSLLALDLSGPAPTAAVLTLADGDVTPVRTTFGGPVGVVGPAAWARAEPLPADAGPALLHWWQVALAVECAALSAAALAVTVELVSTREQFGHPIAAFQAVRHRLAECAVLVEGATWLAREAAALGAPAEAAATACAYATSAARRVVAETHQLSGAIGFTTDYSLHLWTTRAQGLTLELGGPDAHGRRAAYARWNH